MEGEESKIDYAKVWNAYLTAWKTRGVEGRITAHDLCMLVAVHFVLLAVVCVTSLVLASDMKAKNFQIVVNLCAWAVLGTSARIIVPAIVRRLHDTGRSASCLPPFLVVLVLAILAFGLRINLMISILIGLIAVCLLFRLVYILAQKGQEGYNQYGPEPCASAGKSVTK